MYAAMIIYAIFAAAVIAIIVIIFLAALGMRIFGWLRHRHGANTPHDSAGKLTR